MKQQINSTLYILIHSTFPKHCDYNHAAMLSHCNTLHFGGFISEKEYRQAAAWLTYMHLQMPQWFS